jgi:hypothetical protein
MPLIGIGPHHFIERNRIEFARTPLAPGWLSGEDPGENPGENLGYQIDGLK